MGRADCITFPANADGNNVVAYHREVTELGCSGSVVWGRVLRWQYVLLRGIHTLPVTSCCVHLSTACMNDVQISVSYHLYFAVTLQCSCTHWLESVVKTELAICECDNFWEFFYVLNTIYEYMHVIQMACVDYCSIISKDNNICVLLACLY